jgi:hypothetical protein|uniref:Uncharacterized protein n=1 Tax=Caudovirales sp. ctCiv1 TaxID=2826769 RepID=A0A8S5M8M1_9CAUD|nr:hypothetical protein [uncultured Lachnoclostridium sp.]DAD78564.1 MAG TPA: hypothetical protein [Caudovirales sp. ctCiv1]
MGLNDYLQEFCAKYGYTGKISINDLGEYIVHMENDLECSESTLSEHEYQIIKENQIKELLELMSKGIEERTKLRK